MNTADRKNNSMGFIKVTDKPVEGLTSEQKVMLNKKGNILFNNGEFLKAERIFLTTGYSDGLTRVADKYCDNNKEIHALKLYILAHNKNKAESIYENLSKIVSIILKED